MDYWNREAQRVLRTMLVRAGVRRKRLRQGLRDIGVDTTEAAIANRIYRGTLSLAFVLQVAAVLGLERLDLKTRPPTLSGREEKHRAARDPAQRELPDAVHAQGSVFRQDR
jgi:chemotaxis regulatin CheY-phosphate phosphatase CheZ